MCVNFRPPNRQEIVETFHADIDTDASWPPEAWQDYLAPIIRHDEDGRRMASLAAYSMVPKQHLPPALPKGEKRRVKRFETMNCRIETIGALRSYRSAWAASDLCLIPMRNLMEPFYGEEGENERSVRWRIEMADGKPFAVAGIWRSWPEKDGSTSLAFSQITINANTHSEFRRFHRPGDEKRCLVIVRPDEYDDWLSCGDPEQARSFLRHFPAELLRSCPDPLPPRKKVAASASSAALFES